MSAAPAAASAGPPAPAWHTAAGLLALAALTLLLHHGALQGGWRNDDPMLLAFAAAFSPLQYFFTREGLLQLSYASIAPWGGLFFDAGLALFGLEPRGHYAHMLAVLWASAGATALWLRRWLDAPAAWAAGALFLAMPPTGAIAQQLMTGHYAYGLLFTVAALAAFTRAVERDSLAWAAAAAGCYGLATLCKELYVTLPVVLLAWPQTRAPADWRRRLRCLAPVLAVAAGYAALRLAVLGGIGGYAALADGPRLASGPQVAALLHQLLGATLGIGPWGALALLALAGVVAAGWRSGRRPGLLLMAAAAIALLLPSLPAFLLGSTIGYGNDRIAFALGWAVAVLAAWQMQGPWRRPAARGGTTAPDAPARPRWWPALRALPAVALLVALLPAQRSVIERTGLARHDPREAEYTFLLRAAPHQVLVPHAFEGVGYLDRLAQAMQAAGRTPARRLRDEDELAALGTEAGRAAWAWQAGCDCLRPLGAAYDERVREHERRLQAGAGRPLSVAVQLDARGRSKLLHWEVSGQPAGVIVEVQGVGRLPLPPRGSFAFGLDYATPIGSSARLRFLVTAPDGALQRSDWLSLPLQGLQSVRWSNG